MEQKSCLKFIYKIHRDKLKKAKEEYGVTEIGNAPNYSPIPSTAVNIKDTPYWYDFYAYKEKIIPQKRYCSKR